MARGKGKRMALRERKERGTVGKGRDSREEWGRRRSPNKNLPSLQSS